MDIYAAHQPEINAAWDAVEARIDSLPPSLAAVGRRFLESVCIEGSGHRIYFSSAISPPLLYVPLWLRDQFRREGLWPGEARPDPAGRILLAGMWGYFYIRIQDDIIDGSDSADAEFSLFGNTCIAEMFAHLHAATAGAPSFWQHHPRRAEAVHRDVVALEIGGQAGVQPLDARLGNPVRVGPVHRHARGRDRDQ